MPTLKFTRLAQNDLYDVVDYIAHDNPVAAYEVHDAILKTCQHLAESPQSAVLISTKVKGLRRAVVTDFPSYLIFYSQITDGIEIIRIGEGHRDWISILN